MKRFLAGTATVISALQPPDLARALRASTAAALRPTTHTRPSERHQHHPWRQPTRGLHALQGRIDWDQLVRLRGGGGEQRGDRHEVANGVGNVAIPANGYVLVVTAPRGRGCRPM